MVFQLPKWTDKYSHVSFSSDGSWPATAGFGSRVARLWAQAATLPMPGLFAPTLLVGLAGCAQFSSNSWHRENHGCPDGERMIVIALCVWRLLGTSWRRENEACPDGERLSLRCGSQHSRATSVCNVALLFSGPGSLRFGHHFTMSVWN